jgi:hypothetical protein
MSQRRDESTSDRDNERDPSLPALRGWWSELSPAAKLLIPTSAAMLVFVSANALPPVGF